MTNIKTQRHKDTKKAGISSPWLPAFFLSLCLCVFLFLSPATALASDPITELREKIDKGTVSLEFDAKSGYLASLLKNLNIPVSSQALVFSKTSLQSEHISPATPRAMYFNDDVYVGWVPSASFIEIMSVDPQVGAAFYILGRSKENRPVFERSTGHECSVCHFSMESPAKLVPRFFISSVVPDPTGNVEGTFPMPTTDQSLFKERWGGWYVTGTHGDQKHLGNVVLKKAASPFDSIPDAALARSGNVVDLSSRFDTSRYLSPHSDIVALMVLAHQVEVHNLMALATLKPGPPQEIGERLVKALLFAGAEPLTAPVKGTSNFAAEFAARGPRDGMGRSLREFDLKTRLFRYPLSYLVYSDSFDQMPDAVKTYVYRRLREVLTGQDKSKDFAYLYAPDRAAILGILRETKKGVGF